jgi:hypothetical protein
MTLTAVPARTEQQRLAALEKANRVRTIRAQLKKDLKAGRVNVIDILEQPTDDVDTMKVFDLLFAVPKFGRVKVNKLLVQCRISPSKTVGGMSQRQRTEIVDLLLGRRRAPEIRPYHYFRRAA